MGSCYPEWTVEREESRAPKRKSTVMKLDANGMRLYSVMRCVYGCDSPEVVVPSDSFKSHKKEAIDEHLSTCKHCPDAARPTKRSRGITVAALANIQAAPIRRKESECVQCLTLVTDNDRLVLKNDQHSSRIHTLETQMAEMQSRTEAQIAELQEGMQRMRMEITRHDEINQRSQLWQQRVSKALGVDTPPIPADHVCVERIDSLRKAASLASLSTAEPTARRLNALEREVTRLREAVRLKGQECQYYKQFEQYWKLGDVLFRDRERSIKDLRELIRLVHPDKFRGAPDTANGLTRILNYLVQELRKASH